MTALPSLASHPTFAPTSAPAQGAGGSGSSSPKQIQPGPSTQTPHAGSSTSISPHAHDDPLFSSPSPPPSSALQQHLPTTLSNGSSLHPNDSIRSFSKLSAARLPSDGMIASVSMAGSTDWEAAFTQRRKVEWGKKVFRDLEGWRGGVGRPRSSYPRAAMPVQSYFGQPQTGVIGVHLPKEMVRVERDWSGGEVCQFETTFPMELEGRITPKEFINFIQTLNDLLVDAYSIKGAVWDNAIGIVSLWTSLWWRVSTFERGLRRVESAIADANVSIFNAAGLHVLSPRDVALQFLEIEYY